jgi:hypothetical protein
MDIITIEGIALQDLFYALRRFDESKVNVHTLRVARDVDEVKFKINEGVWSPGYPMAEEDRRRQSVIG